MMMTAAEILGRPIVPSVERIDAPGWGECFVRRLSPFDLSAYINMLTENEGQPANFHARAAVYFACHEDGSPLFKPADAEQLGANPAHTAAILAITDAGLKLNKVHSADPAESKKN